MKTNKVDKKDRKFFLKDIFHCTWDLLSKEKYITKEQGIISGVPGTASKVYAILNERNSNFAINNYFPEFVVYHNKFKEENATIIERKHNLLVKRSSIDGFVTSEDMGNVVNAVYRFMCFLDLMVLTKPHVYVSRFFELNEGERANFFVKLTHQEIFADAIYFRWIDRHGNIGSFFLKMNQENMKLKIDDCIGISAVYRKKKTNRYTGACENILSQVLVLENYGSK